MPPPKRVLANRRQVFVSALPLTITARESVREEECEMKNIKTHAAKDACVSPLCGLQSRVGLVPVGGATTGSVSPEQVGVLQP